MLEGDKLGRLIKKNNLLVSSLDSSGSSGAVITRRVGQDTKLKDFILDPEPNLRRTERERGDKTQRTDLIGVQVTRFGSDRLTNVMFHES